MCVILTSSSHTNPLVGQLEHLLRSRHGLQTLEFTPLDAIAARCRDAEGPALIVVVLNGGQHEPTLEAVRRVRELWLGDLLVVGPATDPKLILRSMQAGADLFLDAADLRGELDAALARIQTRRGEAAGPGQLVAVLSASGGCGASTIAVNLAVLFAKALGRCNLIDLNLSKADLAPLLDLKPQYSIADLCRNEDRLDRTLFARLLTAHASGVELLAAPRRLSEVRSVTARGIGEAVTMARDTFPSVVVDLTDCFQPEQAAVLEQATRIFLVCRLDFTAIRHARQILDYLRDRGVPRDRIDIVVNQVGLPHEVPVEDAEAALGGGLTRFIPHDPETIRWADQTGVPAALTVPGAAVVQSIARLVGLDTPPPPRSTLLTRFRSWVRDQVGAARSMFANLAPAPSATSP